MAGPVRWLTAFIDMPVADVTLGADFWKRALDCELSQWRGDDLQYATLVPRAGGEPHLQVQGLAITDPRMHLDLHVDDVAATARHGEALGAEMVLDAGYRVLRSPGGFTFCVVPYHGEALPSRVDQLSIDVPAASFDAECSFWSALTGLALEPSPREEFVNLHYRDEMPLRLLLQKLGASDRHREVVAHLDVSAGDDRNEVVAKHVALGAQVVSEHRWWTVMRDPVGQTYCITRRDPQPAQR